MNRPYPDPHAARIESIERMAQEQDDPDRVLAEITWLIAERKRFREALEFYGVDEDGGDIAQFELTR